MKRKNILSMALLFAAALAVYVLSAGAKAQDFYGEGNVLIAVDMAPYAENDEVSYPEDTMGTLQWGEGAPTGKSTRPDFSPHAYKVSDDVVPPATPAYEIGTVYTVGQKVLLPFDCSDQWGWLTEDELPAAVFKDGAPLFLIHSSCVAVKGGVTYYYLPINITETYEVYPCVDFLEIECVEVTEYSTIWQYTGNAFSNRPDFDPDDYVGAVELTEEEIQFFIDTCDEAYTMQGQVYGDPRWEDARGDRDGKAAYVALDLSRLYDTTMAYYSNLNTECVGFDCLIIGANYLPERRTDAARQEAEDRFTGTLIHELNHYIVTGCIGHEDRRWSLWTGEAFAQSSIYAVRPQSTAYLEYRNVIADQSSRLRVIPGMLWEYGASVQHPAFKDAAYTLGPFFLRYIERETTGQADGRLWTDYFSRRTPEGSITARELDGYLKETTGEGVDAWMARFMAAVVAENSGAVPGAGEIFPAIYRLDPYVFLRPWTEYGTFLSFDGAADEGILAHEAGAYGLCGVAGGGTTYAWRNDDGGPIAVTGADDRWWFFAAQMDFPSGERPVIDISGAEDLAKIGQDPYYPLSGRYRLTADIDLGGKDHPWTPIGCGKEIFTGEFDGGGHSVRGLYINRPDADDQALFGSIGGNAEIRDLTVYGSVTGRLRVGAVVGYIYAGGTVRRCAAYAEVRGEKNCGGIAGANLFGTIENCRADCTVEGTSTVGGIIGFGDESRLYGCTASGTVTGDEAVGGIAGYQYLRPMENCTASATVTGRKNSGGLAGVGSWAHITNCRSTGAVAGAERVGGVLGNSDGCTLSGCSQSGSVTGNSMVGGIVGRVYQSTTIQACYQTGTVRGAEQVGGIAGVVQAASDDSLRSTVQDCYNAGSVSGEGEVGGVVGRLGYAAAENCYSYQPGLPAVGGIHADESGETGTVTGCYALSETATGEGYLRAAQFAQPLSFDGWDFESVWSLENGVRPVLRRNREKLAPPPVPWYPDLPEPQPEPESGPEPEPESPAPVIFSDVAESDWFYAAVQFVAQKGYFLGIGEGKFSPALPMTRGMFMTVLARMADETIEGADWQERGVAWAVENGVSDGGNPNAPITRQELVTMLWRAVGSPEPKGDLTGRPDGSDVDAWAAKAAAWALETGVMNGDPNGNLRLRAAAARAELAQFLMNYLAQERN